MESGEFFAYVTNPSSVGAGSLAQVEDLVQNFPFCQTAQLLYALNLYSQDHPNYSLQLKRAAAYAADRRQLKRLIDLHRVTRPRPAPPARLPVTGKPAEIPRPSAPVKPTEPVRISIPLRSFQSKEAESPSPPSPLRPLSHQPYIVPSRIKFRPVVHGDEDPGKGGELRERLLEIVHKRLAEIADQYVTPQPATIHVEPPAPRSKQELIDRFIHEEPRISTPRTALIKPLTQTPRDPQEDEEIVSETLAILYFKQGNMDKSIRVYKKLCLLFPEKSTYFAARITELKNQRESQTE